MTKLIQEATMADLNMVKVIGMAEIEGLKRRQTEVLQQKLLLQLQNGCANHPRFWVPDSKNNTNAPKTATTKV